MSNSENEDWLNQEQEDLSQIIGQDEQSSSLSEDQNEKGDSSSNDEQFDSSLNEDQDQGGERYEEIKIVKNEERKEKWVNDEYVKTENTEIDLTNLVFQFQEFLKDNSIKINNGLNEENINRFLTAFEERNNVKFDINDTLVERIKEIVINHKVLCEGGSSLKFNTDVFNLKLDLADTSQLIENILALRLAIGDFNDDLNTFSKQFSFDPQGESNAVTNAVMVLTDATTSIKKNADDLAKNLLTASIESKDVKETVEQLQNQLNQFYPTISSSLALIRETYSGAIQDVGVLNNNIVGMFSTIKEEIGDIKDDISDFGKTLTDFKNEMILEINNKFISDEEKKQLLVEQNENLLKFLKKMIVIILVTLVTTKLVIFIGGKLL